MADGGMYWCLFQVSGLQVDCRIACSYFKDGTPEPNELLAGRRRVDGRTACGPVPLGPATTRPGPDVGLACGLRSADERKDGDLAWGLGAWGMEMGEGVLPPIGGT